MLVSFCGVLQPRLDAPLLFTASPTIASMSLVAAYAPGVLNGAERQSATAASGVSKSFSSSPSCAHGALSVGWNFQLFAGVAEPVPGNAAMMPAIRIGTDATASNRIRLAMRSPCEPGTGRRGWRPATGIGRDRATRERGDRPRGSAVEHDAKKAVAGFQLIA